MHHSNILVIITDQQRKDSLGCYGNQATATPHLDRLASDGVRFERAYVANPICMPNRLSIFSGMLPRNHGLWTNGLLLPHERPTLATELAKYGYQTASFGKIHFTPYGADAGNLESLAYWRRQQDEHKSRSSLCPGQLLDPVGPYWGFEHVELTIGHTNPVAHYGRWFEAKGGRSDMLRRHEVTHTRPIPPELHDSAFVADRTVEFLRHGRDKTRPFLVVASFPDPHHPWDPPHDVARKYPPEMAQPPAGDPSDLADRPPHYMEHYQGGWHRSGSVPKQHPSGVPQHEASRRVANTYAMVDLIDQNVGKIMAALALEGLVHSTTVVFTSDHGELLGDHGLWMKGPFFYEGLVNVPLIISGPGIASETVSHSLFSAIDLVPTLCELTGLPIPSYVDGLPQAQVLAHAGASPRDRCLIEYRNGYGPADIASFTMVTEDWKYTRYQTGEEELTHLAADPAERANMAPHSSCRSVLRCMREELLCSMLATQSKWPEQVSHA